MSLSVRFAPAFMSRLMVCTNGVSPGQTLRVASMSGEMSISTPASRHPERERGTWEGVWRATRAAGSFAHAQDDEGSARCDHLHLHADRRGQRVHPHRGARRLHVAE